LTIPPDTLSAAITVPVCRDQLQEPNETFFMSLSNAENATFADKQGRATIQDAAVGP
jgi:hypothetical protein